MGRFTFAIVFLFAVIALPVFLVILVSCVANVTEQQRRTRIREWAMANGWMYQVNPRVPWLGRLPGRHRRALGVSLTARLGGHWVTVTEYSYVTRSGSGDSETTTRHHYIVVAVQMDRAHPWLAVHRRGLVSQFGRALFGDAATATGNALFDSRFRIDAFDARHAKVMVSPGLVQAHVAGAVPEWSLVGNELLTYTRTYDKIRDPGQIPMYAAQLLRVADLLGPVAAVR
ncbi:hypothetical protein [Nocardia sp. CDC160]|uniref:hypothetical protein n=1 Tax=Nocardia sp. CDC160 TaxID=3112166 RepID=UPI002DBC2595|nr:hypothetical protein [Nocardia sp. CDC160]MEC3916212.1 hypothetical protein [Nocardia sp. CDC160]